MASTTAAAVRAAIVARLNGLALTTSVAANRGRETTFKVRSDVWSIGDLFGAQVADDRTCVLRWAGGMETVAPTNAVEIATRLRLSIEILYLLPNKDQSDALDARIQQDALDFDADLVEWAPGTSLTGVLSIDVVTDAPPRMIRDDDGEPVAAVKEIAIQVQFYRAA